jgi:hypothetical protein
LCRRLFVSFWNGKTSSTRSKSGRGRLNVTTTDEQLLIGWVAKALDMLQEVDDEHDMGSEWRADLDALKVRYFNKVNAQS